MSGLIEASKQALEVLDIIVQTGQVPDIDYISDITDSLAYEIKHAQN